LLHFHCAADGIYDAWEFDKDAITGGLDYAATVLGDLRVDQFFPMRLKEGDRSLFVGPN
jgi:hypothetical protein